MKTFVNTAAQGEIIIRRLARGTIKREDCTPLAKEGGRYIIGHSETGHHHCLSRDEGCDVMVLNKAPEGMRILYAILDNPVSLDHHRDHDTHESIMLEPGEYEFRIAREFDPYAALARRSAD